MNFKSWREGFGGSERPEGSFTTPDSTSGRTNIENPVRKIVEERLEQITNELEEFTKQESEDSSNPVEFIDREIEEWKERHKGSENVDSESQFERVQALLALYVEKGAEWTGTKKKAVARVLYGYAQQSLGYMTPGQQQTMQESVLNNPTQIEERIGHPTPNEQKLIDSWLEAAF